MLFYFIIRPDLGELGWLPRRIYRETSPLLLLSLISSARPPLASRLTEKLESRRRIRGSSPACCSCCCCCCSLCSLPLLFCLRHLLLEARLQLVCLGFGTSRRGEDRVVLLLALPTRRYRHVFVDEVAYINIGYGRNGNRGMQLEFIRFAFD